MIRVIQLYRNGYSAGRAGAYCPAESLPDWKRGYRDGLRDRLQIAESKYRPMPVSEPKLGILDAAESRWAR